MPGRIKSGEGTLIGNAGEYYVMAELLKRGIIAALAPRNAPGFDILATKPQKNVRIRVKTKSEEYDAWQWVTKKDGSLFRYLQLSEDFTVLVDLSEKTSNMKYFVMPTVIINEWLTKEFIIWRDTPGKNGRPHAADNRKRNLGYKNHEKDLSMYLDNWESLWI